MKKLLYLILPALTVIIFFGCSKSDPTSSQTNNGAFGDELQVYLNCTLDGVAWNQTNAVFTAYHTSGYPPFSIEATDTTTSPVSKVTMCFQSDSIGIHALKNWEIDNATEFSIAENVYKRYSTIAPLQNDSVGTLIILSIDHTTGRIWGTFAATIKPDTISFPDAPPLNISGKFNLAYKP
ncbi:MAG TPA: hypothetical protein VFJ29_03550 [Candidatus Kapabacteria bacterium]|nr:hypothetical protein [Candidatus Kapabacteria bacterium]